jgi:hypothetical protein
MILRILVIFGMLPAILAAQDTQAEAAEQARAAWLEHDVDRLLAGPDPITLSLPGAEATRPLSPGQAASLLREFFRNTEELGFSYGRDGTITGEQGYIEASREFVIIGTTESLTQKVLIGFRSVRRVWHIYEIRIRGSRPTGG